MRIGYTLDACMTADARHAADMATASATMLAVLHGEMPAPRGLRWQRKSGGYNQGMTRAEENWRALMDAESAVLARRTDRDACPMCAVRADIGCKHRRVA